MRFESVTAHAFGALAGASLELAPGFTVVFGPNESAKSTWHAAMFAALCGQRRGRGQRRADERAFADQRRPWGRGQWLVSCVVETRDGQRIEFRHDLEGIVDCSA